MEKKRKLGWFIALVAAGLVLLSTAPARRAPSARASVVAQEVTLNTKTLVYHCSSCALARQCGNDCVKVDLYEAVRRHARPCELCGGACRGAHPEK